MADLTFDVQNINRAHKGSVRVEVIAAGLETRGDVVALGQALLKRPEIARTFNSIGDWADRGQRVIYVYEAQQDYLTGDWIARVEYLPRLQTTYEFRQEAPEEGPEA